MATRGATAEQLQELLDDSDPEGLRRRLRALIDELNQAATVSLAPAICPGRARGNVRAIRGEVLRHRRLQLGRTLTDVAHPTISRQALWMWESGRSNARLDLLHEVCDRLDLAVEAVLAS